MPQRICPACAAQGLPGLHSGAHLYCDGHRRAKDQARGTTTQRGYHARHQATRQRYLARYEPGQPCAIGGEPLSGDPALLDLAHNADRTGYLGLACRQHNRGHHDQAR